eukprot:PhF_6_TR42861/c0_g1_i1/m.64924
MQRFVLLLSILFVTHFPYCIRSHNNATRTLLELYNATNGPRWKVNTNWGTPLSSPCTWYGISCTTVTSSPGVPQVETISGINLTSNALIGDIRAANISFAKFTSMLSIDLRNNTLSGFMISPSKFAFPLQTLQLDNNFISGTFYAQWISATLKRNPNFKVLGLTNNRLTRVVGSASAVGGVQVYLFGNPLKCIRIYLLSSTELWQWWADRNRFQKRLACTRTETKTKSLVVNPERYVYPPISMFSQDAVVVGFYIYSFFPKAVDVIGMYYQTSAALVQFTLIPTLRWNVSFGGEHDPWTLLFSVNQAIYSNTRYQTELKRFATRYYRGDISVLQKLGANVSRVLPIVLNNTWPLPQNTVPPPTAPPRLTTADGDGEVAQREPIKVIIPVVLVLALVVGIVLYRSRRPGYVVFSLGGYVREYNQAGEGVPSSFMVAS